MTILEELAAYAMVRTKEAQKKRSLEKVKQEAIASETEAFRFEEALKEPGLSFICECKKASPSKGLIAPEFPYLEIAKQYEEAGADCISVLTEPKWFLGKDAYLREIAETVSTPCIRKDFVVDEYMIYEAKVLGASAVLLICAILEETQLKKYIEISHSLGLSALIEAHSEDEIKMALSCGANMIGVNNRNLHDFSVNTDQSLSLREKVPSNVLFVSESGIKDLLDIKRVKESGADAVLIGEALMRSNNKKELLQQMRNA